MDGLVTMPVGRMAAWRCQGARAARMRPLKAALVLRGLVWLMFCSLMAAASASEARGFAPRVAVMNFICEDNSYRSTSSAADFTARLQVELAGETNFTWVERVELQRAEQEMSLTGFGLIDRTEAIRGGRWAKADWAVFGRIGTNAPAGRAVSLEVVDLAHANVLADSVQTLAPSPGSTFRPVETDVSRVASALRELLGRAAAAEARGRGKPFVALLFLSPGGILESPMDLESSFRRACIPEQPFRLTQFQRNAEAIDETELVLSGLAEAEPDFWEKLADVYVWGAYTVREIPRLDAATRRFVRESILTLSLNLWDGHSARQVIELGFTNQPSATLIAEKLVESTALFARQRVPGAAEEGTRRKLSDELVRQAIALAATPRSTYLNSPEGGRHWLEVAHVAETACFFDPANISAQELWTRFRFSRSAAMYNKNEFFFARRRSQAWKKHVDQFGFRSVITATALDSLWDTNSIASEYVRSAWRPLEMFKFAQDNQAQWGVPQDAGAAVLLGWQRQFAQDFFVRLLKAGQDPAVAPSVFDFDFFYAALQINGNEFVVSDPTLRKRIVDHLWPRMLEAKRKDPGAEFDRAYLRGLRLHFDQLGQPAEYQLLLKQFDDAGLLADRPKVRKVKLPRITQLEPAAPEQPLTLPSLDFDLPIRSAEASRLKLPREPAIKGVKAIALHQRKLWLALLTDETAPRLTEGTQTESELVPLALNLARLWCLEPARGTLTRVSGPLATNVVSGLASLGDELWISTAENGLAAWNPDTGRLRWFGRESGLATNQFSVAAAGQTVFALGGMSDLSSLRAGESVWQPVNVEALGVYNRFGAEIRRLAAGGDGLLLFNGGLLACDLRSNVWSRWDQRIAAQSPLQGLGLVRCIAADTSGRFWVGSDSGLHFVEPGSGAAQSLFLSWKMAAEPANRERMPPAMPFGVSPATFARVGALGRLPPHGAAAQSADYLAKLVATRQRLAAARKHEAHALNPYLPKSRVPELICGLASDGEYLWVLTSDGRLLLYHPASRRWVTGVRLPGSARGLTIGAGKVWVAMEAGMAGVEVHSFDLATWTAIPRDQWTPDEITAAELSKKLAGFTPRERAFCRLLWDDAAAAVELLNQDNTREQCADTLFLLALAYDESGLNQPGEAQRYADLLLSAHPDSPYAIRLLKTRKLSAARSKALERIGSHARTGPETAMPPRRGFASEPPRSQELLADYDADGDGALDAEELALVCELEPERVRAWLFPVPGLQPSEAAQRLLRDLDMNRDGRLDTNELARAASSPRFGPLMGRTPFTNMPPGMRLPFRPGQPVTQTP